MRIGPIENAGAPRPSPGRRSRARRSRTSRIRAAARSRAGEAACSSGRLTEAPGRQRAPVRRSAAASAARRPAMTSTATGSAQGELGERVQAVQERVGLVPDELPHAATSRDGRRAGVDAGRCRLVPATGSETVLTSSSGVGRPEPLGSAPRAAAAAGAPAPAGARRRTGRRAGRRTPACRPPSPAPGGRARRPAACRG